MSQPSSDPPRPVPGRDNPVSATSPLKDDTQARPIDPLIVLEEAHAGQLRHCDALERIADALPSMPGAFVSRRLVQVLDNDMRLYHADVVAGLFPLLRQRCPDDDRIGSIVDRLDIEDAEDDAMLPDVLETLRVLGDDDASTREADIAGYVLRGFFESRRRHVAWMTDVVMPIARMRLSPADRTLLLEIMARHRAALETQPSE